MLADENRREVSAKHTRSAEGTQVDYLEKARELADSYPLLVQKRDELRRQYEESKSWFYTRDEIIYKLSQGAHEQSERVQTSGTSNPVERTVLNCDKVLASMNREVQSQRTEQRKITRRHWKSGSRERNAIRIIRTTLQSSPAK